MKKTKESFHFECASVKIPAVSMTQQLSIAMAVKEAKEEGDGGDAKAPWREPKEPEPAAPAMAAFPEKDREDAEYLLQKVTEEAQRVAKEKIAEVTKEAEQQKAEMMKQHQQAPVTLPWTGKQRPFHGLEISNHTNFSRPVVVNQFALGCLKAPS